MISGAQIIQLTGGLHTQSIDMDGREMTKALAIKLNANWLLMQVPLVVQSKLLRDLLMQEPEMAALFDLFDKMDMAFVGLGSCLPTESMSCKAGLRALKRNFWFRINATTSPKNACKNILPATQTTEFMLAFKKTLSLNSAIKLSRPINRVDHKNTNDCKHRQ